MAASVPRRLTRDNLFFNGGDLTSLPAVPPLRVDVGELFLIETFDTDHAGIWTVSDAAKPNGPMAGNPWTGPVVVEGIKAGDVVAITIETLDVEGHSRLPLFPERQPVPAGFGEERLDFVTIENGVATMPGGVAVPTRPMLGCFGLVPAAGTKFTDPGQHGGNMDIPEVRAGSTIHIRAQRDGAWFACGDAHARQGEGELNGFSLEVSAVASIRIERSDFQSAAGIVIETADRVMSVVSTWDVGEAVRTALSDLVAMAAKAGGIGPGEAYQLVSHCADLRLGAAWPMWDRRWSIPTPVVVAIDRSLISFGQP